MGATLPKDLAERFHLDVGDQVFVVATEEGLLITPCDPTFEEAITIPSPISPPSPRPMPSAWPGTTPSWTGTSASPSWLRPRPSA